MRKGILSLSNNDFKKLILESDSLLEVRIKLGYSRYSGGASRMINKRIKSQGLDISHFTRGKDKNIGNLKHSLKDVLIENSSYTNRTTLKNRLVKEGLLKYKCEGCGNTGEWNGIKLTLQLDHKNGINNDHRLENLRFLCPNCHSQTETFSGKSSKENKYAYNAEMVLRLTCNEE